MCLCYNVITVREARQCFTKAVRVVPVSDAHSQGQ